MQLRVGSEVVTLIDFESDLAGFGGVEGRLLDGNHVEHFTFVATLAHEHLVFGVVAGGVRILQIAELDSDGVRAVLQVVVRVLSLRQDA